MPETYIETGERSFEYSKPSENEDLMHKIALNVDGKNVGQATLEYRNQPFPFYYVDLIFVNSKYKGQGFGREIFEQVNDFLDKKGKPGLLVNAINRKSPARGMYERHGWKPISGHEDWMGYEVDEIDQAQIAKAIYAIESRELRADKEKPEAA